VSNFQIAYVVCLSLLTLAFWRGNRFVLALLWANCMATLGIALAMDVGVLTRNDATLAYATADVTTGAVLTLRPGLPHVVAALYVLTVPLYGANLIFGLSIDSMFGVIYIAALAQLGAVLIGNVGSSGGGGHRRFLRTSSLASSARNCGILARASVEVDRLHSKEGGV
jgi:hypothetical protein